MLTCVRRKPARWALLTTVFTFFGLAFVSASFETRCSANESDALGRTEFGKFELASTTLRIAVSPRPVPCRCVFDALVAGSTMLLCEGEYTVTTSDDAARLSNCSTYNGNVIISSQASGSLTLDGVSSITGDLRCSNASQLNSIGADRLATIQGTFELQDLALLSVLNFPNLHAVNIVNWVDMPALDASSISTPINMANTLYISNTGLTRLDFIHLESVGSMDVNSNQYLDTLTMNDLGSFTRSLSLQHNTPDLEVNFSGLVNAANMTMSGVSSVAMPSLAIVSGSMAFDNCSMNTFTVPSLTITGGTIAFVDNPNLQNLSFPILDHVSGGVLLGNNNNLEDIPLNTVSKIDGDVSLQGSFDLYVAISCTSMPLIAASALDYPVSKKSGERLRSKPPAITPTFANFSTTWERNI